MYLWALDENNLQKIMVDYYKQWAEKENANPGYAWKDSFESLLGMALDDFCKNFDAFMLQNKEYQLAILKTNDAILAVALKP
jgi:hypothetical protein